jgi:hypothetical protein
MWLVSWGLSALSLLQRDYSPVFVPAYIIAAGLTVFTVAGSIGRLLRYTKTSVQLAALCLICDHFLTMHLALFAGFIKFSRGNTPGTWRRTPRIE